MKKDQGDERQLQLTVQGFNADRVVSAQSIGLSPGSTVQSNQVNILNLPLPDAEAAHGESLATKSEVFTRNQPALSRPNTMQILVIKSSRPYSVSRFAASL